MAQDYTLNPSVQVSSGGRDESPVTVYLRLYRIPGDLSAGPPAGSYSIRVSLKWVIEVNQQRQVHSALEELKTEELRGELNAAEELASPHYVSNSRLEQAFLKLLNYSLSWQQHPILWAARERQVSVKHNMRPSKQVKGKWSSTRKK